MRSDRRYAGVGPPVAAEVAPSTPRSPAPTRPPLWLAVWLLIGLVAALGGGPSFIEVGGVVLGLGGLESAAPRRPPHPVAGGGGGGVGSALR